MLIVSALMSPAVQAGPTWVFFTIGLNGKTALVAENITFNPFNSQYYYTFAVANTTAGGAKVNGFFIGVGNQAAALAGGQSFGAGAAGGADPPFPAGFGAGGASPILSGVFIAGVPLNPAGTPWGFEEFDGVNSYVMRWYDSVQGATVRAISPWADSRGSSNS